MNAPAKPRPEPTDFYQVAQDVMSVMQHRRATYETLCECGHRRPDPREERVIASLEKAAELADLEHMRRKGHR